jgi:hypothetical protein
MEIVGQQLADRYGQFPLAMPAGEPRDSVPKFGGGDGSCRHLADRQRVKPGEHSWLWRPAGQLRDHVGVEDDHASNSAARGSSPLRSGRSSPSARPSKRVWIRLPRPRSSAAGASRSWRIARTSASIDRPCRAASTRSRACVTGSSPRTVSVAIAPTFQRTISNAMLAMLSPIANCGRMDSYRRTACGVLTRRGACSAR